MKKRLVVMSLVLSIAMSETLAASECPAIKECGVETVGNPYRAMVTAYCEPGKRTATGSSKQEGIVAAKSEWMGSIAAVYKVESDGSIGDFIGYFPIDDTGYGHALVSDQYKSEILKNKKVGTIETGLTLDFRQKSYRECKRWMLATYTGHGSTGSECWVQIIKGVG